MKRLISITIILLFTFVGNPTIVKADAYAVGYSEWSDTSSGAINEVSAIQYGRKLPLTWSTWSNEKSDSKFQKSREGSTNHYSYSGNMNVWYNTSAKELFTWNFGKSSKITYFYADVDTFVGGSWINYIGPPLYLYCDGKLISSTTSHNHMYNWNPSVNCNCEILTLSMGEGGGNGRNMTSIVGTWATTTKTEYSYVTSWDNGTDWRFGKEYEEKYGNESQIPVQRTVYSYPLTYKIEYELDGGTTSDELVTSYTVLDEVSIPTLYKKGYEFQGFYSGETKLTKIEKGTYGDLKLTARFKRKKPTLTISTHEFIKENKQMPINELLEVVCAKATDELDSDISGNIKVDSIEYTNDLETDINPEYLDLSKSQKIIINFSVKNSGGIETTLTRYFYILEKHIITDLEKDDIRIYTRYLSEDYQNTLDENSIWWKEDYQELLQKAYQKMKGE